MGIFCMVFGVAVFGGFVAFGALFPTFEVSFFTGGPLVAILWGRHAQPLIPLLGDVPHIASAHPSPLSASRGFFGSQPFSRANTLLEQQGAAPIDWRIPA